MPKPSDYRKSSKKSNGERNVPQFRFLNHSFTREQQEELDLLDLAVEFPLDLVYELVSQGYKFGLSYDSGNNTAVASLTDKVSGSAFENACVTGRGSTPADAWHALCYRHYSVAQEDWAALDTGGSERPRYS